MQIFKFAVILLIGIIITPAFASVETLNTEKKTYFRDETIKIFGTVNESANELVSIVLRDPNGDFVLITQSKINQDNTFSAEVTSGNKFIVEGMYNATAFIETIDNSASTTFQYTKQSSPITKTTISKQTTVPEPIDYKKDTLIYEKSKVTKQPANTDTGISEPDFSFIDPTKGALYYLSRYYNEPAYKAWFDSNYPGYTIEEAVGTQIIIPTKTETLEQEIESPLHLEKPLADFVDPKRDPEYYLSRYYNEPAYKAWFDSNYPGYTIEEAVGYEGPSFYIEPDLAPKQDKNKREILPEAEAASISNNNSVNTPGGETAQVILVITAIVVLLGATYGVKRKVDDNSKQISLNRETIRKKIIHPIIGSDPLEVLQMRLVKGEISTKEFDKLKRRLQKTN